MNFQGVLDSLLKLKCISGLDPLHRAYFKLKKLLTELSLEKQQMINDARNEIEQEMNKKPTIKVRP